MITLLKKSALALMVGLAGGAAFHALGLPLPWTLGSMTAAGIAAVAGRRWELHPSVRNYARPVIGVMAGSAFTPAVVGSIALWWPAVLSVLAYTLLTVLAGYLYFSRVAGFDRTTSFFASAPGGLAELTLLGGSLGGDFRQLVLIHSIRIVIVVFCAPFIIDIATGGISAGGIVPIQHGGEMTLVDAALLTACVIGAILMSRLVPKLPAGIMLIAILLSAVVHGTGLTAASPPGWLVALVQVVIGSIAGSRLIGVRWKEMVSLVLHAAIWAAVLLAGAAAMASVTLLFVDQPPASMMLALMPGGTAEMIVISYTIGIEVAFVVTAQVCRILAVHISVPLLFHILRIGPSAEKPAE